MYFILNKENDSWASQAIIFLGPNFKGLIKESQEFCLRREIIGIPLEFDVEEHDEESEEDEDAD